MDVLSENAVSQGMVLASLIGGIALASIAQLVSAFPDRGELADGGKDTVSTAITWLAVTATVMMINVWSGIIFFMDDGGDRRSIAVLFYGGLLIGVLFFALGMAETVAIRAARLRRPILIMFGGLLVAEAVLALVFLAVNDRLRLQRGAKIVVVIPTEEESRSLRVRMGKRRDPSCLGMTPVGAASLEPRRAYASRSSAMRTSSREVGGDAGYVDPFVGLVEVVATRADHHRRHPGFLREEIHVPESRVAPLGLPPRFCLVRAG